MSELPPKESLSKKERLDALAQTMEKLGASIVAEKRMVGVYILSFRSEDSTVTIRVSLDDYSGADLVITNITTLPKEKMRTGLGSKAVGNLISWAKENNLTDIRAVQVGSESEGFWLKNGFAKCAEPNPTNDFVYIEKSAL